MLKALLSRARFSRTALCCFCVARSSLTATVRVGSPEAMENLGADLASRTGAGDTVCLHGDVGAGKTCFARGFIRARTADPGLRVTSPSYLLDNSYEADDGLMCVRKKRARRSARVVHLLPRSIHHMDLYRLSEEADLRVLNLEEALAECAWPNSRELSRGRCARASRLSVTRRSASMQVCVYSSGQSASENSCPPAG